MQRAPLPNSNYATTADSAKKRNERVSALRNDAKPPADSQKLQRNDAKKHGQQRAPGEKTKTLTSTSLRKSAPQHRAATAHHLGLSR
jgi:hypothetical protein